MPKSTIAPLTPLIHSLHHVNIFFMPIPYHLGGDPVVKLPQSAKSTRLFFREEGNILMPQLPNNPRLRFLIVETLSSSGI